MSRVIPALCISYSGEGNYNWPSNKKREAVIFALTYTDPKTEKRFYRTEPEGQLRRLVSKEDFERLNAAIDRYSGDVTQPAPPASQ